MNILSIVSERLKELMNEAELNVPALADKINMDASCVLRFVKAERLPATDTLVKLADVFQCTTDYMLGLSDVLDDRKFKRRPPFSERLKFLLKTYNITRYKLEHDTEFSEQAIKNWYRGTYEPTIESLIKLSKYFKCSVDFVLGREE